MMGAGVGYLLALAGRNLINLIALLSTHFKVLRNKLPLLFLRQFETINPTIIDNSGVYDLLARFARRNLINLFLLTSFALGTP